MVKSEFANDQDDQIQGDQNDEEPTSEIDLTTAGSNAEDVRKILVHPGSESVQTRYKDCLT